MTTKYLKNASILSVASALALQGFALLTFMLLAHHLQVPQMGAWALWLTFVSIADMTRQGFVQNGLVRFTAAEPSDWGRWLTAALALNSLSGLGLGVLLACASWLVGGLYGIPELQSLALWTLPFSILQGLGRFAEAVQVAKRDFMGIFWGNVINGGLQFGLTALFFLKKTPLNLPQLLVFQLLGIIGSLIFSVVFCKKYFAFGHFEKDKLAQLFRFGKYVAGTNFCSLLFQRLDVLLIGAFLSPAIVAVYNVATRLNGLLDLPLNSLSLAQFPNVTKELAESKPMDEVMRRTVRKLMLVQLPLSLLLIVLAPQAVGLLAGENYASAAPILQILALAGLAKPWGRAFGMTLDATGRSDVNFKMLLFSMLVNLTLNLTLLPIFGMTGAAVATGLGILLTVGAGQLLLRVRSSSGLNEIKIAAPAGA
jgi:O-antigen/teichoic acid export membrane protein